MANISAIPLARIPLADTIAKTGGRIKNQHPITLGYSGVGFGCAGIIDPPSETYTPKLC